MRPSYIYRMDDKYSGCNIVESAVTEIPRKAPVRAPKSHKSFFVRLLCAAAAVGAILVLHYLPIAALAPVKSVLRDAFCYDVFGRSDFGSSTFFAAE